MVAMVLATSVYFNYSLYNIVKDYNIVATTLTEEVKLLTIEVNHLTNYENGWNAFTADLGLSHEESQKLLQYVNRKQ